MRRPPHPRQTTPADASTDGRDAARSTRHRAARRRRTGFARPYGHLWFVLPGLLFFVAFMIYPAVSGFALSSPDGLARLRQRLQLHRPRQLHEALTSWPLYRAAWHNLIMFVAILIFQHTVGLFIAVQLHAKPRFMEVYRTILFLPVIISLVSTGFIWTLMLSPNIGVINPVLHALGLGFLAAAWLTDPALRSARSSRCSAGTCWAGRSSSISRVSSRSPRN